MFSADKEYTPVFLLKYLDWTLTIGSSIIAGYFSVRNFLGYYILKQNVELFEGCEQSPEIMFWGLLLTFFGIFKLLYVFTESYTYRRGLICGLVYYLYLLGVLIFLAFSL